MLLEILIAAALFLCSAGVVTLFFLSCHKAEADVERVWQLGILPEALKEKTRLIWFR